MTSAQIRQSFLDFFASQGHTIVPSSSLLPDSPGLLFTNAGMNQFVPIFLGDRAPDVSKWAGVRPSKDTRAADTQKCIRAGGKHNDLEDVGFDTYHHTMFEMLGNWSFGDYFKQASLTWGWGLLTKVWGIPPKRLFATVYQADKSKGDPAEFDQEAYDIWAGIFEAAGLDPTVHIVNGNKRDNFWMMGDTGPCGPCSEIHFNLLPDEPDDTDGKKLEIKGRNLVNAGSSRCIEIWNHVFIQFNANADGTFAPLAAKHVDTGMGFERVAGIYATTKGFTDFTPEPSNYNSDAFTALFDVIAKLSGKTYQRTVPTKREGLTEQENTDIAFRVLADHARCVSCAIADGILPSNDGRNYVIRRILRRGILYGKKLGLPVGFFEQLVAPVVESLGRVFPELVERRDIVQRVIRSEEESFGRTLDKGLGIFVSETEKPEALYERLLTRRSLFTPKSGSVMNGKKITNEGVDALVRIQPIEIEKTFHIVLEHSELERSEIKDFACDLTRHVQIHRETLPKTVSGALAFQLYDTFGFPLDMTQLLATERGLTVDTAEFERLMEEQRKRGQASTKKTIVVAATEGSEAVDQKATVFTGYNELTASAKLVDVIKTEKDTFLVFDQTPFYGEMGGQAGDTGTVTINGQTLQIVDAIKDKSGRTLHKLAASPDSSNLSSGSSSTLSVDVQRRRAISRHHSAEHLVHWALRKTLGTHVRQAGTHKTPERMRFDFSHFEAVTPAQLREIEQLVNERILDNAKVEAYETEFDKKPEGTLAFFGEKYGKIVRVVDIGGYSRELCGGTHVSTTGEIGLIKIVSEAAIAAGTRRVEVVAGQAALDFVATREAALATVAHALSAGPADIAKKVDALLAQKAEIERKLKSFEQKASAGLADELIAKAKDRDGLKFISAVVTVDAPDALRALGSQVIAKLGEGIVQLGAALDDKVTVVAFCSPAAIKAGHQAGKIVSALTAQLGGKGGGKPDFAMGGGKDTANLAKVLGT